MHRGSIQCTEGARGGQHYATSIPLVMLFCVVKNCATMWYLHVTFSMCDLNAIWLTATHLLYPLTHNNVL